MSQADSKIPNGDAPPQMPPQEPEPSAEEVVTREIIERVVENANPDYELIDFTTKPGTQAGDNFMSIMFAVTIEVKSKSSGEKSTLHVMLKTIPRNIMRVQMINDSQAFVKEARMYDTIFPAFVEFQKNQGLKGDEIFHPLPTCYASFNDGKNDYIAMQNLRYENFRMGCRRGGLGLDESLLVIKSIAKFHALSYAKFQGSHADILAAYPVLEEKMFMHPDNTPEMYRQFMASSNQQLVELIREKNPADEEHALALQRFGKPEYYFENMYNMVGLPVAEAVIGHGDCWTNNFLFKYDEVTGKPLEVKFLDFQLARACSRAIDLGYFLYSSPTLDILNNKEELLLRAYFDEFEGFLKKLGYPERNATFEDFQEEFNKFRSYGVAMGLMLAPIISAQSGEIPDLELMPDEFSEESTKAFFGDTMKSSATHVKVINIAKNHIPKVQN